MKETEGKDKEHFENIKVYLLVEVLDKEAQSTHRAVISILGKAMVLALIHTWDCN